MLSPFRRWLAIRLASRPRRGPRSTPPPYRGPGKTLFLFDGASRKWIVVSWDGSEVALPAEDVEGFLAHVLRYG